MPRPDHVFRTEAIVLRRYDFGEADRLLTLLTPEHGKLRAIARGARKPAGRMTGHVELFSRAKMMLSRGHELYTIAQAEQAEPYLALREDLERGTYAYYLVELLDCFSEFEEPNQPLYALLNAALGWLCALDAHLQLVTRFYELHLLSLVGFQPELFQCTGGREELEPQDQYFSVPDGGVVCPDHVFGRAAVPLSLTALKALRFLQTRDYETVKRRVQVSTAVHQELERILQAYIVHFLEMRLKSVEFIHRFRHP